MHRILPLAIVFASSAAAALAACDGSTSNEQAPVDAGTPPADAGSATDAADACVPGLPAAGFTSLAEGESVGINADIVLTEGGAPVVAYTAPAGDRVAINLVRWDAKCSRWEAPIQVDTTALHTQGTSRQVSLAYDASTGTVGVVYQEITQPLGQNEEYQIRYASLPKGATAATAPERVDDPTVNPDPDHGRTSPGLAMANGKLFVAWHQAYRICGTSGCDGIVFRSKSGGAWSAETVATVASNMNPIAQSTAVAVDSAGEPAVAFLAINHTGPDRTEVDFWRPNGAADAGGASSVALGADVGTDDPNVALAFAGTKPRVAAAIHLTQTWPSDGKETWFAASNDGTTWSAPVAIPADQGAGFGAYVALTVSGDTQATVVADINTGDGTDTYGTPKISRTTDLVSFTTTGPSKDAFDHASPWLRAASGTDGKVQAVFYNPPGSTTVKTGLVYFRE